MLGILEHHRADDCFEKKLRKDLLRKSCWVSFLLRIQFCWEFDIAENSVLQRGQFCWENQFCWELSFVENSLLLRIHYCWEVSLAEDSTLLRIKFCWEFGLYTEYPLRVTSQNQTSRLMFFITDLFWSNVQQLKLLIRQNCLKKCYYFILFFSF